LSGCALFDVFDKVHGASLTVVIYALENDVPSTKTSLQLARSRSPSAIEVAIECSMFAARRRFECEPPVVTHADTLDDLCHRLR